MKRIFSLLLVFLFTVTLVACQKTVIDYYQIGFETNGGTTMENLVLKAGDELVMPQNPTKDGYVFGGWYVDHKLTEKFEQPTKMPKESFWLYADWHTQLTFETLGGTKVDAYTARPGSIIAQLPTPSYGTNIFQGWYLDEECNKRLGLAMPSVNTTVYAKWQAIETTTALDITNSIKINGTTCYNLEKVSAGYKVTALAGKGIWDYFYFTLDFNVKDYQTIVFELEGKKDTKYITKLESGGAVNTEVSRTLSGNFETISWTVSADNLTATGGQKLIIFLNPGVDGASSDAEWILIKSVKLYRHVDLEAEQQHAVFFDTVGGSVVAPLFAVEGSAISAPTNPTKPGYIFDGWYQDIEYNHKFNFDKMPKGPTVVYAKWKEGSTITVKFDTAGAGKIDDIQTTVGSLVGTLPTLTSPGKIFLGWYNDTNYSSKFTDTTYTKDITLYARFIDPATDLNNDTKIDFIEGWTENEVGTMPITYDNGLLKITTTESKGAWSYIKTMLPEVSSSHNVLKLVVTGTTGRLIKIKFYVTDGTWETGNPEIVFTGEEQTLFLLVPKSIKSNTEALIFIDGNTAGTQTSGTEVVIKEIALCEAQGGQQVDEYANYDLLDWKPTVGYWFSQDSGERGYTLNTSQNLYISSGVRFTKEDIPVGSIIVLKEGYQYRPDGWDSETTNNTGVRPGETKETIVHVDEAWWSNYVLRGFNVSRIGKPALSEANYDEFREAFKIYVPKKEVDEYANYDLLDWKPTVGYWFSQDSGERGYTLNTSQNLYISSGVRFTKEDIPVGSIIVLKEGYQYRPDGWDSETTNNTGVRPGETKETIVHVDEAWWSNYVLRGFNVSRIGKPALSEADYDEFREAFKIYVPKK